MAGNHWTRSYSQFLESSSRFVLTNYESIKRSPSHLVSDFQQCWRRTSHIDVFIVISLVFIWTIARYLSTKCLFKPFARVCGLSERDVCKYPESAWKFLFYSSTFAFTVYIVFAKSCCQYFSDPSLVWSNYSMNDVIPQDIRYLYLIEISFYIHSLYAVFFLDEWRKDSPVMAFHHVITFFALSLSFVTKAHRVGILILLLHDGCDVIMEATKCILIYKSLGGLIAKLMDILSAIGFISFLTSWFVCRLYWFPLIAIYSSTEYFNHNSIKFPFIYVLFFILWIILAMDVYWFTFILKLLVNIVTGNLKELEDNREYSEQVSHKNVEIQSTKNGVKKKKTL